MKEFKTSEAALVFLTLILTVLCFSYFTSRVEVAGMEEKRKAYLKKTFWVFICLLKWQLPK